MNLRRCFVCVVLACIASQPISAASLAFSKSILSTGEQATTPNVTFHSKFGFIITWQEREVGGARLLFAVVDAAGKELRRGHVAAGKNWFVNWADFPSLVVLDNGDWVTHWLEKSADSPYAYDIRVARSVDQGRAWGAPLTPHRDGTPTEHGFVSLVPQGSDKVLVVWLDGRKSLAGNGNSHDHSGQDSATAHEVEGTMTLRTATLDRRGRIAEEHELDDSACSCCQTDAARTAVGTAIVYRDRTAREIRDIAAVTRGASGTWSMPSIVHADNWRIEGCPVNGPALAQNGPRQLIVWPTAVSGTTTVRYVLRESSRNLANTEIQPGAQTLGRVDAAAWGDGFLVSWIGANDTQSGLLVAEIAANGAISKSINVAPVPMTRLSGNPRMASAGDRAMIVWTEPKAGRLHQVAYAILHRAAR